MRYQRGLSLSGLMMWGVILALGALLTMKVIPAWIEYGKIVKIVRTMGNDSALKEASVEQIKLAFEKRKDIDVITALSAEDLDISKEGGRMVIRFAYVEKVPLFYNAALVFNFEGGSDK